MEFLQKFISINRPYTPLLAKGIVIHETGNAQGADAMAHYNYWSTSKNAKSSAHIVLDWKQIIQLIPFGEVAWHAGKTANSKFIGIEICRTVPFDKEKFDIEYEAAVGFTAALFRDYLGFDKVTKDNLLSHEEVSQKWGETNHTDPTLYFKQGNKTIDDFRADVQKRLKVNKYSYDKTVDNMIVDGVTTVDNMAYWEKALSGEAQLSHEYVRAVLDRYSKKLNS